jgi:hypothetical protein
MNFDDASSTSSDTLVVVSEPAEEEEEEDDLEELRKKFVGEIDLPESTLPIFHLTSFIDHCLQARSLCSRTLSVASSSFLFNITRSVNFLCAFRFQ